MNVGQRLAELSGLAGATAGAMLVALAGSGTAGQILTRASGLPAGTALERLAAVRFDSQVADTESPVYVVWAALGISVLRQSADVLAFLMQETIYAPSEGTVAYIRLAGPAVVATMSTKDATTVWAKPPTFATNWQPSATVADDQDPIFVVSSLPHPVLVASTESLFITGDSPSASVIESLDKVTVSE